MKKFPEQAKYNDAIAKKALLEMELRFRSKYKAQGGFDYVVSQASQSFKNFLTYHFPDYSVQWFHDQIMTHLDMMVDKKIRNLLVQLPPQHGKSQLTSRHFPAYLLGKAPDTKIILLSYNEFYASRFNLDVQRIMDSPLYKHTFPNTRLPSPRSGYIRNTDFFELVGSKGYFLSAGLGGSTTGMAADFIIIDDPIKSPAEAFSPARREKVWEWFWSVVNTRLHNEGQIIINMTRWHEDDIIGRLLDVLKEENQQDQIFSDDQDVRDKHSLEVLRDWVILRYPAVADESILSYDKRSFGEALWPSRHSKERLERVKSRAPLQLWTALYQQRPSPKGGNMFKAANFRYWTKENDVFILNSETVQYITKENLIIFGTMDLGFSDKAGSSFTVLCVWGLTKNQDLLLLDMLRARIEGASHLEVVWNYCKKWNLHEINIEDVQYQVTLVQQAVKKGLPARSIRPIGSKEARALNAAAKMEAHKIYLPSDAPYLFTIEQELTSFPYSTNNDIVDNFAYAAIRAMEFQSSAPLPSFKEPKSEMRQILRNYK